MSAGDETRDHDPAERIRRNDDLCDRFEDELKAGSGRSAEDFLRDHGLDPTGAGSDLLRDLAQVEAEYRGFPSGTILADRYRVERLLGKGGMGVVYLAYDRTLGVLVALKFLAARLARNEERRSAFKKEVRVSLQVTHDNVCRVYHYDEHEGQPFLSMEYIRGQDLASLLKQSHGLVAEATAVNYARQLCLGLAAAHKHGLLHRDLKPLNVMIDGHGQLRITDFGLAGQVGSFTGGAIREGTPLYQSPEQLAGTEVTPQSDIYALGLVLYEMFTGRYAFKATTVVELARRHRDGPPAAPSSHVRDINPAIDRIILKCLEPDPANRPRSVFEVMREVPGGKMDEAIFRGDTPSPDELDEGGPEGRLAPRAGLALFAVALFGTLLAAWLNDYAALFRRALTPRAPRELSGRAQDHLQKLGYDAPAADSAYGVATDETLVKYLRKERPAALSAPKTERFPVMYFWYRQSSDALAQRLAPNDTSGWSMPGRVLPNEPPLREPGMMCVFLALDGRLLELHAVLPRSPDEPAREPDPAALFAAAGFVPGSLRESKEFRRVPPVFADRQMAWEGTDPQAPEVPVRVEAAFYRGRPVYFHVGVDGHPDRLPGNQPDSPFMPNNLMEKVQEVKNMLVGLIALPIGMWFAWRNWQARRANPRGAALLAGCFVALGLIGWLLAAHHILWPKDKLSMFKDELSMFTGMLGRVLFDGLLLWLAYLALEPWVRRTNPERVVSWNRLLLGKWSDPLVGRDVLIGGATAAGFMTLLLFLRALPGGLGYPPDPKIVWDATFTEGVGGLILTVQIALMVALRNFFLFFLVLLVCRGRARLAAGLNVAVWWALYAHGGDYELVRGLVGLAFATASLFVLLRTGLLGFVAFNVIEQVLIYLPVTIDFSTWYAGISARSLLLVVGLAAYGFWAACRRPGPVAMGRD